MILYKFKGEALSPQELDTNFESLDKRLGNLEKSDFQDFGIARIEQSGVHISFIAENDVVLGSISLPVQLIVHKGQWQPHITYSVMDMIIHEREVFLCKENHQATSEFNSIFWHKQ
jgi:hypothetical protein